MWLWMPATPDSYSYPVTHKSQFALMSDAKNQLTLTVQSALTLLLSPDALN